MKITELQLEEVSFGVCNECGITTDEKPEMIKIQFNNDKDFVCLCPTCKQTLINLLSPPSSK